MYSYRGPDETGHQLVSFRQPSAHSDSASTLLVSDAVEHNERNSNSQKYRSAKSDNSGTIHDVPPNGRQLNTLSNSEINPKPLLAIIWWWIPELAASALSVICILCIAIVLRIYDGRVATDLYLSGSLTLNGLIAALATFNRACLTAPVCSAIMQEMWIYFANESEKENCASRLKDLDIFHKASTGSLGSLEFLIRSRGSKYVASRLSCNLDDMLTRLQGWLHVLGV